MNAPKEAQMTDIGVEFNFIPSLLGVRGRMVDSDLVLDLHPNPAILHHGIVRASVLAYVVDAVAGIAIDTDPERWSFTTDLTLRIRRDDGAVVHLDGSELTRTNMPAGPVTAATHALSSTNDAAETEIHTIALPGRILAPGTHVLAVEVHQYQPSSSDLTFDLALAGRTSSW